MTRVAIAGDWHASTKWMEECVKAVSEEGVTTLLHLGDFGYKLSQSLIHLWGTIAKDYGVTIKFIDGNHDNHDILPHNDTREYHLSENIVYLPRGYRFEIDGTVFLALGGAVSVDKLWRGPGEWWYNETITLGQAHRVVENTDIDVMLTHDCPTGVSLDLMEGVWPEEVLVQADAHRDLLRSVVDAVQPKWLFHGHYHQFHYGQKVNNTNVVGLACDGMVNNTVIFDLDTKEITAVV